MAVDVTEAPTFKTGFPKVLFQIPVAQVSRSTGDLQVFGWDVAPDEKRFFIDIRT